MDCRAQIAANLAKRGITLHPESGAIQRCASIQRFSLHLSSSSSTCTQAAASLVLVQTPQLRLLVAAGHGPPKLGGLTHAHGCRLDTAESGGLLLTYRDREGSDVVLAADHVMLATGRRPNTAGLGLQVGCLRLWLCGSAAIGLPAWGTLSTSSSSSMAIIMKLASKIAVSHTLESQPYCSMATIILRQSLAAFALHEQESSAAGGGGEAGPSGRSVRRRVLALHQPEHDGRCSTQRGQHLGGCVADKTAAQGHVTCAGCGRTVYPAWPMSAAASMWHGRSQCSLRQACQYLQVWPGGLSTADEGLVRSGRCHQQVLAHASSHHGGALCS